MMGGCRCSFKNCTNTTKTADNMHFFHYPVKSRGRCITWIENACKPNFYDLEEDKLRNKVVCEVHFENKWFLNEQKKRLLPGAIPTLDGGNSQGASRASPVERNSQVYLPSNQYSDIKVVPTNEEGTVFVLDTENMFTISPKIESYIIKNGVLIPTNANNVLRNAPGRLTKQLTSNRFTKPSTSATGYVAGAETEIANINTPPGPSKPLAKDNMYHSSFIKEEINEYPGHNSNSPGKQGNGQVQTYEEVESTDTNQQEETKPNLTTSSQGINQGHNAKTTVTKNYLRQIKKHSRDIASIKRMLKQKRMIAAAKPNIKTILSELQQHIPSSLYTIISLILGEKSELNDDDIDFFTNLHRTSPEMYQLLSEKYKWNLPSVDIVDTSSE